MSDAIGDFLKNVSVVCRGNATKHGIGTASSKSIWRICFDCKVAIGSESVDQALIRLRNERLIACTNSGWWVTKHGEERIKNADSEITDEG